jgi:putative intracellular protease/amidase
LPASVQRQAEACRHQLADPPNFYKFTCAGFSVTIASIKGGKIPLDPNSMQEKHVTQHGSKFLKDPVAMGFLTLSKPVTDVIVDEYDVIYLPGGARPTYLSVVHADACMD